MPEARPAVPRDTTLPGNTGTQPPSWKMVTLGIDRVTLTSAPSSPTTAQDCTIAGMRTIPPDYGKIVAQDS